MNNNLIPNYKTLTRIPLFRRAVLQSFPFIEEDFDALTDYELLCKVVEYLNKVIEQQNLVGVNTDELLRVYLELKSYVENYFDNLDVQEEINNKLDDMAESGELTDIIAQYLSLAGMITFNTVSEMKLAENLVNGSKCRTLGYNTVNDKGGAYYRVRNVTNEDTEDDMFIIALYNTNLVAELIKDEYINIKQIGILENENQSSKLTSALSNYKKYIIPNGTFKFNNIELPTGTQIINNGKIVTSTNGYIFKMTSVNNVVIDGGEYEGQNTSDTQSLFNLSGSSYCILKNMTISKALNKGIEIGNGSTNNTIDNIKISGCTSSTGAGISIVGATTCYNTITNIKTSVNRIGITLNGCYYNNVSGLYSNGDSLMGLTIDGIVTGAGDGGCYNNCDNIHISGITTEGYGGIYLGNTSCYNNFNNVEVKDSATSPGIKQTNSNGNGNNFTNIVIKNTVAGIVFSNCHYNTLSNFYISPASGRGIYIAGADHCVISNGTVYGANQGILVQAGYCTLSNLKIHANTTGIQLAFGLTSPNGNIVNNIDFADNTTDDFIGVGIYSIDSCTGYVVSNFKNESKSNSQYIAHGLSGTPKSIILSPSVAGHIAYVMARSDTNFQVGLVDNDGNAVTTQETIYWWAHL